MSASLQSLRLVLSVFLLLGAAGTARAQSIPIERADVNKDCVVDEADRQIVQAAFSRRCGHALYVPAADVNDDCVVNNTDLTFVVRNVGALVCTVDPDPDPDPEPDPDPPTISASISPSANAHGWHNTDVVVSFACTHAVSCPDAVTVTTEGEGQVVQRTVSNSSGATASTSVTLHIEKTRPALSATVAASALPGQTLPVTAEASALSGIAGISLLVGNVLVDTAASAPFDLAHAVASNALVGATDQLDIVAESRAGNRASLRRVVAIESPDETPPVVSIGAPATAPPGARIPLAVDAFDDREMARVALSQHADDPEGHLTLEDRGTGPFAFQFVAEIPEGLADGDTVTYAVLATDAAGNTASDTATVRIVTTTETSELRITVIPPLSPTFQPSAIVQGGIGEGTAAAPAAAPPIVAGVSPQSGRQGQTLTIEVHGINTAFSEASLVTFGPGLSVLGVHATDPFTLAVQVAIAADASVGPRLISVQSGQQESFLASAFTVRSGFGTVTGRLLGEDGTAVAGAQICLPNSTICTTTDDEGRYTFDEVTSETTRVVVSAPGFEGRSLDVKVGAGDLATLGEVALVASNLPPPPPLPNSPPVSPLLAVALGRGATVLAPGGNQAALERVFRDAVVAAGGAEIGVFDTDGRQLNPRITGAGVASFTPDAVAAVAGDMIAGDTVSFAETMKAFIGSLQFPSDVPKPTLLQLIRAFQELADDCWANPSRPEAPLVMLLFNQGRVASPTAPRITFDTRFNALQRDLLVTSFMAFVYGTFPEASRVTRAGDAQGWLAAATPPAARPWAYRPLPRADWQALVPSRAVIAPLVPAATALQLTGPQAGSGWNPATVAWDIIFEKSVPQTGWAAAKTQAKLCDDFLVKSATVAGGNPVPGKSPQGQAAAVDPYAKFLPAPGCEDILTLAEMLVVPQVTEKAGKALTSFLASERINNVNAARIQQTLSSSSFQKAYAEARAEVIKQQRTIEQTTKFLKWGAGLVEGQLAKIQGDAVSLIFNLQVDLIVESLRPRAPFIRTIEQLPEPATDPVQMSRLVRVIFDRSPNHYERDDNITWKYFLIRGRSGEETPVAMKVLAAGEEAVFQDEVPSEGTYAYRIRAMRVVGTAVIPDHHPSDTELIMKFVSGIVPGGGSKTPAGNAILGTGIVKTVTDPLAEIYKGLHVQTSNASEPALIYISVRPPQPRPIANMAVHGFSSSAYLSVPALDVIMRHRDGLTDLFAHAGFAAPGQAGLAVDSRGDLYTNNAASDMKFGGRIFSFQAADGARTLAGTVNYYSSLLMYAHPVSVQSLLVAPSPQGESLYIADSLNQRITKMALPWTLPGPSDRNVSQPYVTHSWFNFGPQTTMAMRPDATLAVTMYDNVLLVSPDGTRVSRLFAAGGNPFTNLTGVAFDPTGHMYLSDATAGTITMVPIMNQGPNLGLAGVSEVGRRKLTVLRGSRRPADIKLAPHGDGLVFYDAERAFVPIGFGMAGQVLRPDGSPIGGADVLLPEYNRVSVTDGDGVFVIPDLVAYNRTSVFDVVVRHDGTSQSYTVALDRYKHNVVDLTFNPPVPPPPGPEMVPLPKRRVDIPVPPTRTTPETVTVEVSLTAVGASGEELPDPHEDPEVEACPRVVFLGPGLGVGVLTPQVTVTAWSTVPTLHDLHLVVNGVPASIHPSTQRFTVTPTLHVGQNLIYFAVPAAHLKAEGCAEPSLDDDELVSVSTTHTLFHDTRPQEIARYRQTAKFDLSIRGIIREHGHPVAGLSMHVPGTEHVAWTDNDGVFQLNLPTATVSGQMASADALASALFQRAGQIVAHLALEKRAEAIAALEALLAQAISIASRPPPAAASTDDLLAVLSHIEGAAGRILVALQSSEGIPDPDDVEALESLVPQLAAVNSGGDIVVRGGEYTELSFTVRVQP